MNKYYIILICVAASVINAQVKQIYRSDVSNECGLMFFKDLDGITSCTLNTNCDLPETRDQYNWIPLDDIKIVKTRVRVVRETDGSNPAATEREVRMQMHHLNKDFASAGIQFTYELDYIDDSAFRSSNSVPFLVQKMSQYTTDPLNYCNIFVSSGPASFGFYPWLSFGSIGLFINSLLQFYPGNNRSSLTHEMGHELGLYHTFAGYSEVANCNNDCAENTSTTNNDLRGDYCSDTPPQDLSYEYGFVPTMDSCNLPNLFPEIPHINYQSYSDNKLEFTTQQIARMHCLLENHPLRVNWIDNTNPQIPYVYTDDFGNSFEEDYRVIDLNWIDITTTGTEVSGLQDDNFVGPFNLNYDFQFYGQSFNQFYIGSNGYISFSPFLLSYSSTPFPSIPSSDSKDGFIAPFLADLTFTGINNIGKVFYLADENNLIVSFIDAPLYNQSNGFEGRNTFQLIIDKNENKIIFNYLKMDDYYPPTFHKTRNPSIIGIESPDGLDGLEVNNYRIPRDSSRIAFHLKNKPQSVNESKFLSEIKVNVFPNPSSSAINFKWNKPEKVEVSIYNILGEKIYSFPDINSTFFTWNFQNSNVSSGIYYYSVTGKRILQTGKLMVIK